MLSENNDKAHHVQTVEQDLIELQEIDPLENVVGA